MLLHLLALHGEMGEQSQESVGGVNSGRLCHQCVCLGLWVWSNPFWPPCALHAASTCSSPVCVGCP